MLASLATVARAAMSWLLDGSDAAGPVAGLGGTRMGYRFLRGNTETLVLWDYSGSSAYVSAKAGQLCDWMGNCAAHGAGQPVTLAGSPVYLVMPR